MHGGLIDNGRQDKRDLRKIGADLDTVGQTKFTTHF